MQEWRSVIGWPEYMVSNIGNVRRVRVGLRNHRPKPELTASLNGHGYFCVGLCRNGKAKTLTIHKLVAEAFIGPRPDEADGIDHIDGDKQNNDSLNLRYATAKQQKEDKSMFKPTTNSPKAA